MGQPLSQALRLEGSVNSWCLHSGKERVGADTDDNIYVHTYELCQGIDSRYYGEKSGREMRWGWFVRRTSLTK